MVCVIAPFQPSSNHRSNYFRTSLLIIVVDVNTKDPIQHPYCGSKNMRPSIVYTSFRNLNDGGFVLVRLHDPMANFSLGGTIKNHFTKITRKFDPIFKKHSIYLYISLFDWIRWVMCSPHMHILMKNNEHPKTYNMH